MCVIGPDGRLERVNAAWEVCLGWEPTICSSALPTLLDFVHPEDRPAIRTEMGRIADFAAPTGFETSIRGKDGVERRLQWKAIVSPERRLICAAARDVPADQELERKLSEASLRVRKATAPVAA